MKPNSNFNLDMSFSIQSAIFPKPPVFALFSDLVFYFDPKASLSLELARLTALHYQGTVAVRMTPLVTHVIMKECFPENFARLAAEADQLKRSPDKPKVHIVSAEWILQSAEQGERLVESAFAMKAIHSKRKRERQVLEKQKEKEALAQESLVKSMSASLN